MAFPFYWMLATSFKSPQEALQAEPVWVPERMKPANWLKAARLGDSPLFGGLGPGRSVALFFPGPEALPPRALVPRSPGAFFDPVADGTRVEVARGEGGWWVRLTNMGEAGFRRVPLVVLWPKGVRMGMFCRLGSELESLPVAVAVWLKRVWRRPVLGWTRPGRGST